MASNTELVSRIHDIVYPYYQLEIGDIYGDRGSTALPNVEDLTMLFFKRKYYRWENGKKIPMDLNKEEEQTMIEQINQLHIGTAERIKIEAIGIFIWVELPANIVHETDDEETETGEVWTSAPSSVGGSVVRLVQFMREQNMIG